LCHIYRMGGVRRLSIINTVENKKRATKGLTYSYVNNCVHCYFHTETQPMFLNLIIDKTSEIPT
jgi:hypothetical protein